MSISLLSGNRMPLQEFVRLAMRECQFSSVLDNDWLRVATHARRHLVQTPRLNLAIRSTGLRGIRDDIAALRLAAHR
jgi:hypothetical protein